MKQLFVLFTLTLAISFYGSQAMAQTETPGDAPAKIEKAVQTDAEQKVEKAEDQVEDARLRTAAPGDAVEKKAMEPAKEAEEAIKEEDSSPE